MKLFSIQVGLPKTIEFNGRVIVTSIYKEPVTGPVMLRTYNLEGDGQADLTVHGGRDKAVYGYGLDAYAWWVANRPQDEYPSGAFGENLTFNSLPENQIHIGDTYSLGDAIVQVSEPRFPCYKLNAKFADKTMGKTFMQSQHSGVYFRVLKEGKIGVNDELKLMRRDEHSPTVQHAFLNRPVKPSA